MKLPRSGRGRLVAGGDRAGRPGAPADDPDPGVPRATARPDRLERSRRTGPALATDELEPVAAVSRRSTVAARGAHRPLRPGLVQGLADLGRGRAGARRRLGAGPPATTRSLLAPLADGGEGTLVAIEAAGGWDVDAAPRHDPLGRTISARWLRSADGARAVVELAAASGLSRLGAERARPDRRRRRAARASCSWRRSTPGVRDIIARDRRQRDDRRRRRDPPGARARRSRRRRDPAIVDLGGLDPRLARRRRSGSPAT